MDADDVWILPVAVAVAVGARVEDAHTLGPEISQAANEFADPQQVPDANFGWSARDACYAYGSFVLEDDEALVSTPRPQPCRFWNLVVWNQFMATPGFADARSSVNGPQRGAQRRRIGDSRAVPRDDGAPESITTLGYPRGNLASRWFLADEVPARPEVRLIKSADAPTSVH